MLDRIGVDGCERITDPWTRTDIPGINEKLAVVTGQNGNVSSRTHKDAYVAAKFLDGDLAASRSGPGCLDQTFWTGNRWRGAKNATSAVSIVDARKRRRVMADSGAGSMMILSFCEPYRICAS